MEDEGGNSALYKVIYRHDDDWTGCFYNWCASHISSLSLPPNTFDKFGLTSERRSCKNLTLHWLPYLPDNLKEHSMGYLT